MAIVNYQILNIGELLYLLPCNLFLNNVRAIEKLNKRFINAKYGKNFKETHIYIYILYISCLVEIKLFQLGLTVVSY